MHARLLAALKVLAPALLAGPLVTAALTLAANFHARTSTLAPEVAVTGVVFQDDDQDGERDPGEPGLPGDQRPGHKHSLTVVLLTPINRSTRWPHRVSLSVSVAQALVRAPGQSPA